MSEPVKKSQLPANDKDYSPLLPQTEACDRRLAKKERSFRKGVVALIVFFSILLLLGIAIAIVLIVSASMKSRVSAANQPKAVSSVEDSQEQTTNISQSKNVSNFTNDGVSYNKV